MTVVPAGLGPDAGPMAARFPVGVAPRESNAASAPSSPVSFAEPCVSRAVDAVPGNRVIRNWLQMYRYNDIRRWNMLRPRLSRQPKFRRK